MQYGRFRPENVIGFELTATSIGELIQHELEQRKIPTKLPTAADWGYTFRTKIGGQFIDVSLTNLDEDGFGIAIEPQKHVFPFLFNEEPKKAVELAKCIVSDVVRTAVTESTLYWYSANEWKVSFDVDFWQPRN